MTRNRLSNCRFDSSQAYELYIFRVERKKVTLTRDKNFQITSTRRTLQVESIVGRKFVFNQKYFSAGFKKD